MSHKSRETRLSPFVSSFKTQRGSALVIGIFIITVMFLLATTLVNVLDDADKQVTLEVWGTRAFAVANSGADRALATLFPINATDDSAASCNPATTTTWDIGNENPTLVGFHACSVVMTCTEVSQAGFKQLLIVSSATCQTGQCDSGTESNEPCIRVNRTVEVEARG